MSHILVVEDEPTIAFTLQADLASEGYDVTVASTGPDALRLATTKEFALILLDVMLPGKDAYRAVLTVTEGGLVAP